MAYVFPRTAQRAVAPVAEKREGFAFGPILFGALLGAGLGVILAMLMDEGMRFAAHGLNLSMPFGAWCAGALVGALSGGLLSACVGGDVGDEVAPHSPDGRATRRNPTR